MTRSCEIMLLAIISQNMRRGLVSLAEASGEAMCTSAVSGLYCEAYFFNRLFIPKNEEKFE